MQIPLPETQWYAPGKGKPRLAMASGTRDSDLSGNGEDPKTVEAPILD